MMRRLAFVCITIVACGGGLPSGNDAGGDASGNDAGDDAPGGDAGLDATTDGSASDAGDAGLDGAADSPAVDTGVSASQPWAFQITPGGWLWGLAVDSQQNVIVGGSIGSGYDFFMQKLDSMGNPKWKKQVAPSGQGLHGVFGITTDAQNAVYAVGTTAHTIDVGGGTINPGHFVVKYDAAGNFIWQRTMPGDSSSYWTLWGVGLKSNGNVVIGGTLTGSTDFGGGTVTSTGWDALLLEVTSSNQFVRAKVFGSSANIRSLAIDKSDNVYIAGDFAATINFGGNTFQGPQAGSGARNIFVAKLDPAFAHLASMELKTTTANVTMLALDSNANVAITGAFGTSVDLGGGALVGQGDSDIFVGKLNSSLGHIWSKRFGDIRMQTSRGVVFDPNNNLAMVGSYSGNLNFGKGLLPTAQNGIGMYLALFDPSGTALSNYATFQSNKVCNGENIAYIGQPDYVIIGSFDTCQLPSGTLFSGSEFVARLSP